MNNDNITEIPVESFHHIYKAFAKAQAVLSNPKKACQGHKYKYSSLDKIIKILRNVLPKYGLGYTQNLQHYEDEVYKHMVSVATIVFHESGESLHPSFFSLPVEAGRGMSLAQSYGAPITYARRYALSAVFCMASEEDTDLKDQKDANVEFRNEVKERLTKLGALAYAKSKNIYPENATIAVLQKIHSLTDDQIKERVKDFESKKKGKAA